MVSGPYMPTTYWRRGLRVAMEVRIGGALREVWLRTAIEGGSGKMGLRGRGGSKVGVGGRGSV